ncbi:MULTISPECIES: hypothetical protein [unclassified Arthrobacter]|uniref:hypothetical protein n=1 Tax=unclassified Arthrobacter TaxID=235627 RepID=UPI003393E8F5
MRHGPRHHERDDDAAQDAADHHRKGRSGDADSPRVRRREQGRIRDGHLRHRLSLEGRDALQDLRLELLVHGRGELSDQLGRDGTEGGGVDDLRQQAGGRVAEDHSTCGLARLQKFDGGDSVSHFAGYLAAWYRAAGASSDEAQNNALTAAPVYLALAQGFILQSAIMGDFDMAGYFEAVDRVTRLDTGSSPA